MCLLLAILCLVTSLVGRTFGSGGDTRTTARAGSISAKVQQLDRDSHDWTPSIPVACFVPPHRRVVDTPVLPVQEAVVVAAVPSALYNRPPPAL